jgi:topoisomerase-4 subunit B
LADADSDGLAYCDAACARCSSNISAHWWKRGHMFVAMPPLYRIDLGKEVYYALDEDEKRGILDRIEAEK